MPKHLLLLLLLAVSATALGDCPQRSPVVLVNGIFGSVLEGSADIPGSYPLPSGCSRKFESTRMWISAEEFLPWKYKCFKEFFATTWNGANFSDVPGLDIESPRFGETFAIEALDPGWITGELSAYFSAIVESLVNLGYKKGVDLVGAAYDWRHLPDEAWFERTRLLIEKTVSHAGRRAVVVAHSMGALRMYAMMMRQSLEWRVKHIARFVPACPPWAGSPKSLQSFFSGYGVAGFFPLNGKFFAPVARRIPGDLFLMPRGFGWPLGATAVFTPTRNYSYDEMADILNDAGMKDAHAQVAAARAPLSPFGAYDALPGIGVTCLISPGRDTLQAMKFKDDLVKSDPLGDWPDPEKLVKGPGDGTVPLTSLRYACDKWARAGQDSVVVEFTPALGHFLMLKNQKVIDTLISIACHQQ